MKPSFFARMFSPVFGAEAGDLKVFHPSETCRECGSKLCAAAGGEQKIWRCPNLDCPVQVRLGLLHWCSPEAMDIPGGGVELVARLVDKGLVRDVAELYRVKVAELAALEGMDQDSARKFFDALTASQTRDMWRVLFGLAIPNVGPVAAQALGREFLSLDALLAAGETQMLKADGIDKVVARSIARWWSDPHNQKLVKRLDKARVNFKSELYRAHPADFSGR